MPDNETARRVCIDYTIAAAKALTPPPTSEGGGTSQRLRFVYLSGGAAERDQKKSLWFKQDYRRIRVRERPLAYVSFPHVYHCAIRIRHSTLFTKRPSLLCFHIGWHLLMMNRVKSKTLSSLMLWPTMVASRHVLCALAWC